MENQKISFIDSENNFKNLLNSNIKGRLSNEEKHKRNIAISEYFSFANYSIKNLMGLISKKEMTTEHKRRKVLNFLGNNPKITLSETLQIDKPKKEDYAQKTFIVNYSLNKWGEIALNGRYEYILKSRFRYAHRFLKMAILNE